MTEDDAATTTHKRQWRLYRTANGGKVVQRALDALSDQDAKEVAAQMKNIRDDGLREGGARLLRGRIWEVRATGDDVIIRLLFAKLGRFGQVLLGLEVFEKKTQKTPPAKIELAEKRLADWQERGKRSKKNQARKKTT